MNRRKRLGWAVLMLMLFGGGFWIGHRVGFRNGNYQAGYQAGIYDGSPQRRAIVVVNRNPSDGSSAGHSIRWFDLHKTGDAARLQAEDKLLTAQGVEHFITKAKIEYSISPEIPPNRVDAHR